MTTNSQINQEFEKACEKSDLDAVARLLGEGADPNGAGDGAPLVSAAYHGRTKVAAALIAAGARFDVVDRHGHTALQLAACQRHAEIVKLLVAAGASLEARDEAGDTCIELARGGDVIKILLNAGVNPTRVGRDGLTPLLRAAHLGDLEAATVFLERGIDVNSCNAAGKTALMCAAAQGRVEAVSFFLEKGARVNAADKRQRTALHYAAAAREREMKNALRSQKESSISHWKNKAVEAADAYEKVIELLRSHGATTSRDIDEAAKRAKSIKEEVFAEEKTIQSLATPDQVSQPGWEDRVRALFAPASASQARLELLARHVLVQPIVIGHPAWPDLIRGLIYCSERYSVASQKAYGRAVSPQNDEGWLSEAWGDGLYTTIHLAAAILSSPDTFSHPDWSTLIFYLIEAGDRYDYFPTLPAPLVRAAIKALDGRPEMIRRMRALYKKNNESWIDN